MAKPPPVSKVLNEKGIPHDVFIHPRSLNSLEQAARERGQLPSQIVRSILFRITKSQYVMVLMAGPMQVDWKLLRRHLGANRITMATKDEVLNITGYQLGAVAPFGLTQPLKIFVDQSVLDQQVISIGSGVRGTAIIMKSADLIRALSDFEIVNFMES